ncbi:TolC family outer membrane protein [Acidomonas methanolica]|uniref:Secretion system type I outer membrane protein TolC n=3 Tax=Acidomonas methanolica TaxID=437 RepID=A0A023D449_ACIMT|nr:TolC family outer membrane protein [Acidomonas methanolica]MBU2653673.1 TolC family outer membrane protein [Acidomonas methanolica]TCS31625.1 outer membrane protein [Acidomonas methanolica]GAJ28839.1 secretion system type I outer membrane protein TolC [Acidomonas methanolica NBRC 104435]GEK98043.1 type I secretion protein TolC [Acidomonas methanolica NBRC 104435]
MIFKRCIPTGLGLVSLLYSSTSLAQQYDGKGAPAFIPHTLREALAAAYLTNPTLQQERATLRATDENVPAALAGWRPTIQGQAALTYYQGRTSYGAQGPAPGSQFGSPAYNRVYNTPGYQGGVTITQPLYNGGKTSAATHQAVNTVMAERANLISTEQQVFASVVTAYVNVIRDEQLLQISINNEHVLQEQVKATQQRKALGELTRTDVAQAQVAFANATAVRQQAEGTLRSDQATYLQVVGLPAAPNLEAPQPLALPVHSATEAVKLAVENNPTVVNALFTEAQKKDAIGVALAAIMPKVSATAAYQRMTNQGYGHMLSDNKYAMLNFQIPIYQGGSEYAAVRQARQAFEAAHRNVDIQRRTALQLAEANWQQLQSYQEAIGSERQAIAAGIVALDGVERQAIVGTSSTLEVLQQQATLLSAQQTLIQSLSNLVVASYGVAAAIGRLTAADLKLDVPLYDEKAYYNAVKDRLWGINDYAVNQPGR